MRANNLPAERRGQRGVSAFDILQDRIDRMFDDFSLGFGMPRQLGVAGELLPSLEVSERNGKVLVNVELPGVEEKDIDISADDDMLTVSGEKRSEMEEEKEGSYRSERSFGRFSRSVRLPFMIDPQKVEARFLNGVLRLTIDRPVEAQEHMKKIPIKH